MREGVRTRGPLWGAREGSERKRDLRGPVWAWRPLAAVRGTGCRGQRRRKGQEEPSVPQQEVGWQVEVGEGWVHRDTLGN